MVTLRCRRGDVAQRTVTIPTDVARRREEVTMATFAAPSIRTRLCHHGLVLAGVLSLALAGFTGLLLFTTSNSASAANVALDQCNGTGGGGGQTVQCDVQIVNTLTDDPTTTGSTVTVNGGTPTSSSDLITSVNQCNGSAAGNGSTLLCSVDIINNITMNGPGAAGAATVNQCNANQSDGLGTAPNLCLPGPATTSGATITQCNESGNGGGLVFPSGCSASGTVSASLPVTVNQCNGSANGGGGRVVCSTTMITNVVDTAVSGPTTTPTTAVGSGTPTTIPAEGTPVVPESPGAIPTTPGAGGSVPTTPGAGSSSVAPPVVANARTAG